MVLVLAKDLSFAESWQNWLDFFVFRGEVYTHDLDIWDIGHALEKLLGELCVHPWALDFGKNSVQIVALSKKFFPFSVPITELLQCFPLTLVIADQFWVDHDLIPVVLDVDLSYIDLFEVKKDLDRIGITDLMILMPTFLKEITEKEGSTVLISS